MITGYDLFLLGRKNFLKDVTILYHTTLTNLANIENKLHKLEDI